MATREVHVNTVTITSLFVFKSGEDRTPVGIIHLHHLLEAVVV